MPAWEFRAKRWAMTEPETSGCAIKGNVARNGRIYPRRSSPWYAQIRMTAAKGKRWFCTEGEAIAAGWRAVGLTLGTQECARRCALRICAITAREKPIESNAPCGTPCGVAKISPISLADPRRPVDNLPTSPGLPRNQCCGSTWPLSWPLPFGPALDFPWTSVGSSWGLLGPSLGRRRLRRRSG